MGDVPLNRLIDAAVPRIGSIAKGSQILDFMSAGWTDERHSLYISSMEASFLEQLYGHEHHHELVSNRNSSDDRFRRTSALTHNLGSHCPSANPSIRHFRPGNASRNPCGNSVEAWVDDHESVAHMIRGRVQMQRREFSSSIGENFVDRSTEVSDQNFADDEVEVDAELSKPCKKRRSSNSLITVPDDQVK